MIFCPLYNLPRFFEFERNQNITEFTKWNCTENGESFTVEDVISMKTLSALNESYDYGIQCMGLEKESVLNLRPTETRKGTFYFTVST